MQTKFRLKVKYLLVLVVITITNITIECSALNDSTLNETFCGFEVERKVTQEQEQKIEDTFRSMLSKLLKKTTHNEMFNDFEIINDVETTFDEKFNEFSKNMYVYVKSLIDNYEINKSSDIEYIWNKVLKKTETNKLQGYQLNSIKAVMQHYVNAQMQYIKTSINEILQSSTLNDFVQKYNSFVNFIKITKNELLYNDLTIIESYAIKQFKSNSFNTLLKKLQNQLPNMDIKYIQPNLPEYTLFKYQQPLLMQKMEEFISTAKNVDDLCSVYSKAVEYIFNINNKVLSDYNINSELSYILYYINNEIPLAREYVSNYIENKLKSMLTNENIAKNNNIFEKGDKVKTIVADFELILQSMKKHEKYLEKYSVKSLAKQLCDILFKLKAYPITNAIQKEYLLY